MKNWGIYLLLFLVFLACEETNKPEESWGEVSCYFDNLDLKYESCLPINSMESLEVVTWNLKTFPLLGSATVDLAAEVIQNMNPDVVALQEVTDSLLFEQLMYKMPGWHGEYVDLSGDLDLAFLYKKCEILSITDPIIIEESIWPRPGIESTIRHINGMEVTLINVHLKCCGGAGNVRIRKTASEKLKEHIERQHVDKAVIVLGDFNDEIVAENPFLNFLIDTDHYEFADLSISTGPESDWSYPSYPSHIDHILITDELFSREIITQTLKLENCIAYYHDYLSDHRPLMISIRP